jgi:general nucleoside transport system permease protein
VRIRLERRLLAPRWLAVGVPAGSLVAAVVLGAIVLLATGHDPLHSYRRLFDTAFVGQDSISETLIAGAPLVFTGLAAAVAFRMSLWNVGAEGQLYCGAIGASGIGLWFAGAPTPILIACMAVAGMLAGAAWALIPALLRAYASTNEIITSLMLNYVAGLLLTYLIFDSFSYWRDTSSFSAKTFPQGKTLADSAAWPTWSPFGSALSVPLGLLVAVVVAGLIAFVRARTRLGFEMQVLGDSARAARYAGIRTRFVLVLVFCLSGACAGLGGASQVGDFQHVLDPRGLQQAGFGYAGIVVAALARYNPIGVVLVAVLIGGLQNAGYALQGADFPSGLVGVLQGLILFSALGGELFSRYRVRLARRPATVPDGEVA